MVEECLLALFTHSCDHNSTNNCQLTDKKTKLNNWELTYIYSQLSLSPSYKCLHPQEICWKDRLCNLRHTLSRSGGNGSLEVQSSVCDVIVKGASYKIKFLDISEISPFSMSIISLSVTGFLQLKEYFAVFFCCGCRDEVWVLHHGKCKIVL